MQVIKSKYLDIKSSISQFRNRVFHEENRKYFAAVSFIPFVGWLFPLYLKRDDVYCQEQAKAGFYMALFFITVIFFFIIVNIFLPREWRIFRFTVVMLIYSVYLLYFILCIYGIHLSIKERTFKSLYRTPIGIGKKLIEL